MLRKITPLPILLCTGFCSIIASAQNCNPPAITATPTSTTSSLPIRQQVIVENYPGDLTLYGLATGNPQARLRFKTGAAFVRFTLDGKKLLVLTSGQIAYGVRHRSTE